MDSQNHKNSLDLKILSLAKKILDSRTGVAEGCREIFHLLNERGIAYEKDFLIFTGVESETDRLPVGPERQYWNKESLKLMDKETEKVEKFYKKDIFEACKKLIIFIKTGRNIDII